MAACCANTEPAERVIMPDDQSIVEIIQNEILRRICFLETRPGTQLKEAELAGEFNVSRTPVRDAISRISHLGLVETRNGVGSVVMALSPEAIRQVYAMRLELAPLIGTMSPRPITDDHRRLCDDLLDAALVLRVGFDPGRYIQINHRLHGLIADLIGNQSLRAFWWQTYYQAASTWHRLGHALGAEVAEALVSELREVGRALNSGDVAAIGHIQRVHIGYGFARIERHILTGP